MAMLCTESSVKWKLPAIRKFINFIFHISITFYETNDLRWLSNRLLAKNKFE